MASTDSFYLELRDCGLFESMADGVIEQDADGVVLEANAAHEEWLRAIVESSPHGIVAADSQTARIIWCNHAMANLFGYDRAALIGLGIEVLHPPDEMPRLRTLFQRMASGDLSTVSDIPCQRRDGSRFFCNISPGVIRIGAALRMLAFFTDVTADYRTRRALEVSQETLLRAQRIARLGSWELRTATGEVTWSPEVYRIFEVAPGEFSASYDAFMRLVHPDDRDRLERTYRRALNERSDYEIVHRLLLRDGRIKWVHEHCETEFDAAGQPLRSRGTVQDIDARVRAEQALRESEARYRSMADNLPGALFRYWLYPDGRDRITDMNPGCATLFEIDLGAIGDHPTLLWKMVDPEDLPGLQASVLESARQLSPWSHRWRIHTPHGHRRWVQGVGAPVRLADGAVRWDTFLLDVSERYLAETRHRESDAQVRFLTYHDALTRLPNRALLRDRLEHAMARARRDQHPLALLLVDLDRFKYVNDTLGHPVGDALLQAVASRLATRVRAGDTLARLGGDEFVILLEQEVSLHRAGAFARRILEEASEPILVEGHELYATASIGICLFPADGDNPDDLLRHAEVALYKAKSQGRNVYRYFEQEMATHVVARLRLEHALRGALPRGELRVHYQPLVRLADGALAGVEALVRWQHPELGLVAPGVFIPVAEEIGLIGRIGAWVLQESCAQLHAWDEAGLSVPKVSVNLSIQQLEQSDLAAQVAEILAMTGLPAQRLELEVTESMLMQEPEQSIATLGALRELGLSIAVDDFGTGYSSLAYLKRLPLQVLKIDRSFVSDIGQDGDNETIVRAIIALGRSLGLEVVAEGVEEAAQACFLKLEGCRIAQGFLFGRPVPASRFRFARALLPV